MTPESQREIFTRSNSTEGIANSPQVFRGPSMDLLVHPKPTVSSIKTSLCFTFKSERNILLQCLKRI